MRARSLKPSIFKNELLAVADPLYTVIFEGLWCAADREGRLEDRPARVHFDINPGRSYDGTVQSLDWLAANRFIDRYEVDGLKLIQVVNFTKHQNPHHREPGSIYPAKPEAISGCHPEKPEASPSLAVLTPDSGLLTPDSGLLTPAAPGLPSRARGPRSADVLRPEPAWFVTIKRTYPDRAGNPGWDQALAAAEQRIREGITPQQLVDGVRRYGEYVAATGAKGTQYVKAPANFLGPEKAFLLPWALPVARADAPAQATKRSRLRTPEEIEAEERTRAAG